MIAGRVRDVRVSRGAILDKVSPEDIYRFYWRDFEYGKMYHSPFREEDGTPSFGIVKDKVGGKIKHRDFGDLKYSGDCFDFVGQMYGMLLRDVLVLVDRDLNLGLWSHKDLSKPMFVSRPMKNGGYRAGEGTLIQVEPRKFSPEEYAYWALYGLDKEDLKAGKVFSVGKLWINRRFIPNYEGEMKFAYLFERDGKQYVKVYTPLALDKKNKFVGNVPGDLLAGKEDLPFLSDTVIVTKSRKDNLVLRKIHSDVCSVQSESHVAISDRDIEFLRSHYKRVVINFDPDKTGVEASTHYNQYGFGYFNTSRALCDSGIKDMADLARAKGIDSVREYLKEKGII